ncbi:MAG: hypothetical protein OHK0013_41640 [Sandaracinaceae bacterium]
MLAAMRAITLRSLVLLALLVTTFVEVGARAQASPSALEPDLARFGAASCTVSAPRELGRSSVRNLRLRVASQPGASTLAVWSSGEHALTSRRIDAELGAPRIVALDRGLGMEVLAPVSGGRFLALSVGALCSGGRTRGLSCLRAIGRARRRRGADRCATHARADLAGAPGGDLRAATHGGRRAVRRRGRARLSVGRR